MHHASAKLDSIGMAFSRAPERNSSAHYGVGSSQIHQYGQADTTWVITGGVTLILDN